MSENELRPCPFCGEPADDRYNRLAKCSNKQCLMNYWIEDDADFYIRDDWNTRPIEDELRAEIERLKVRIEELEAAGTILRDCFSLHKPNWLIDKDAIKEWDELTKKECE